MLRNHVIKTKSHLIIYYEKIHSTIASRNTSTFTSEFMYIEK